MNRKRRSKFTDAFLEETAKRYASRTDLARSDPSVYSYIRINKLFDKYCSHMPKVKQRKIIITPETIKNRAKEFGSRLEFSDLAGPYYNKALELGILDEVCSHMPKNLNSEKRPHNFKWTQDSMQAEALKYPTRKALKSQSSGAYDAMVKSDSLDLFCAHMPIASTESSGEEEVRNWIRSLGVEAKKTKKVIFPLELDIYVPSLGIAIEYCGLYWHSELHKDKNAHFNKMTQCNKKNIRLITIFEDEWMERKDQVKNFLRSVLGKNEIKIAARKCTLAQVDRKQARQFMEESHIQGAAPSVTFIGLFHSGELMGLVSGNKHHRNANGSSLVLNRLAFKSNVSLQGGSSRLLSALISYAKDNQYSKIVSWSDNRWSEGNVYNQVGFLLEAELPPDYGYLANRKRVSKQSCQKKNLLALGAEGETETEMATSLGYYRIWDCGKKRWTIDVNSRSGR